MIGWLRRRPVGAVDSGQAGRHPTDAYLLRALQSNSVSDTDARAARAHLNQCSACAKAVAEWRKFLAVMSDTYAAGAAQRVSASRLARQKQRILGRIRRAVAGDDRGRVLRFPPVGHQLRDGWSGSRRWWTAAAAAGLILGVLLGLWQREPHTAGTADRAANATRVGETGGAPSAPARPMFVNLPLAMTSTPEENILDEWERLVISPPIPELTPLDAITPRIHDTAVDHW